MRIRFTHSFDLVWKLGACFGALVAGIVLDALLERFTPKGYEMVPQLLCIGFGLWLVFWLLERPVDTYLYVRFSLDTPILFSDAYLLSGLFTSLNSQTWNSYEQVLKMPRERRRAYLIACAAEPLKGLTPEQFVDSVLGEE